MLENNEEEFMWGVVLFWALVIGFWIFSKYFIPYPRWIRILPLNLAPTNVAVIKELEKLRAAFNIPHELFAIRVLCSPATTRKLQKQCLEKFRRLNPGLSKKELLGMVLASRIISAEQSGAPYPVTLEEVEQIIEGIDSIDDLCDYIIELDRISEPPRLPDPIGDIIDAILAEEELEKK